MTLTHSESGPAGLNQSHLNDSPLQLRVLILIQEGRQLGGNVIKSFSEI